MTHARGSEPVEERLADRIWERRTPARPSRWAAGQPHRLGRIDRAAYRAVAGMSTPWLDSPLRVASDLANFSKPWLTTAAVLALVGGSAGRRAAATGVAAIAVTSFMVNQPMKFAGDRRPPDRGQLGVPVARWVLMPESTSFPSGHSASGAAFAVSVGDALPTLRVPLGVAASVVAFSRVYTGVHYPSDLLVGVAVGALLGRTTSTVSRRIRPASRPEP
jgi:membrane-associated phospholipid phosphatase